MQTGYSHLLSDADTEAGGRELPVGLAGQELDVYLCRCRRLDLGLAWLMMMLTSDTLFSLS